MKPIFDQLSLSDIRARLNCFNNPATLDQNYLEDEELIEAAVLLLLVSIDSHWHILLTRRTQIVRDHKGQVAFPGGARELEDASLEMTALRETHEEIGLDPARIQILCSLPAVSTISHYRITPFIGTTDWPQMLHPAMDEVERVFSIPLDWLSLKENWHDQWFQIPGTEIKRKAIVYQPYDGEVLWGISATLTQMLLDELQKQPR